MAGSWGSGSGVSKEFSFEGYGTWVEGLEFFSFCCLHFQHNIRFECFFGFRVWRVGGCSGLLVSFDGEVIQVGDMSFVSFFSPSSFLTWECHVHHFYCKPHLISFHLSLSRQFHSFFHFWKPIPIVAYWFIILGFDLSPSSANDNLLYKIAIKDHVVL
jgi:hypothetical protein